MDMDCRTKSNADNYDGCCNQEDLKTSQKLYRYLLELDLNIISCIAFTLVLILLQIYIKERGKEAKKIKNGKCLGLEDLPKVKTMIPFKLIGIAFQLLPISETLKKGTKLSKEYGDVFTASAIGQDFVGITSASLIQTVLKSGDLGHVIKLPIFYGPMQPHIINGVLVSTGSLWQRQRKILLKSQSFQSLKGCVGMLNRHGRNMVTELENLFQDEKLHQISALISQTFLGVISEMITGAKLDRSDELEQYHHNFTIWRETTIKRVLNPIPIFLLNPIWKLHPASKQQEKAVQEMLDFAKRRLKEHKEVRAALEKKNDLSQDVVKPLFRSVLDELVDAGVDETQILDEINTMMFGGHETGSSAIHFLCFALALNQHVQETARKEVDEIWTDDNNFKNGDITFDSVQTNLKYVERCIYETMRIFPPIFVIGRKLNAPLEIEYQNKPLLLPSGINIVIAPYITHTREDYFPEPLKFDPDRFLPEETAKRHAYSYIPFSAGPRNCLGLKFAMMEMKLITAYILRHFEITTTDKMEDIPLLPNLTLSPAKEYTFQLKKRNNMSK